MSEKRFDDDDDETEEKIGVLRSQALAKPDDKESISRLLKGIALDHPAAGDGKHNTARSRILAGVMSPPPLPPPPLKPSSRTSSIENTALSITPKIAPIVQLAKDFYDSKLENERLEHVSDNLQSENEILQELYNFTRHINDPTGCPNSTKFKNLQQGAHYVPRFLSKLHDMLARERALLCGQIAISVFEIVGTYAQQTVRPVHDEGFAHDSWQENEQGQTTYCFRARKRIGVTVSIDCIIRINISIRRLTISSKDWLQDVKILARNLTSVSLSSTSKPEVILVRQHGTAAEIDTLIFSNTFYSTLFIEKVRLLLSSNEPQNATQHSHWAPSVLDTSSVELPAELHDLSHFVNEKLKVHWEHSPEKEWLKQASSAILLDQERLRYLTGGSSSSITMEFTETMLRTILLMKFVIVHKSEQAPEAEGVDDGKDPETLVIELAYNMHGHWCLVVNRLQELAARGFSRETIPERQPGFFRGVPFDTLPPNEQQNYLDDARCLISFIKEFGCVIKRDQREVGHHE